MRGTTPPGASTEQDAARWVREMFGRVAGRYDLLNHLLSLNIDRWWRRRVVRRMSDVLARPGARILDICCGTGDLALAMARAARGTVFASDFCHPMLTTARVKSDRLGLYCPLFEGDALRLPVPDAAFDLITVAFGLRNFANYPAGLGEMHRVLKPGGVAAILEFSQPRNPLMAALYRFYSQRCIPAVGGLISGSREAYQYLPDSVRKFPGPDALAEEMRLAGFVQVRYELWTGGIVALHLGRRL